MPRLALGLRSNEVGREAAAALQACGGADVDLSRNFFPGEGTSSDSDDYDEDYDDEGEDSGGGAGGDGL